MDQSLSCDPELAISNLQWTGIDKDECKNFLISCSESVLASVPPDMLEDALNQRLDYYEDEPAPVYIERNDAKVSKNLQS